MVVRISTSRQIGVIRHVNGGHDGRPEAVSSMVSEGEEGREVLFLESLFGFLESHH